MPDDIRPDPELVRQVDALIGDIRHQAQRARLVYPEVVKVNRAFLAPVLWTVAESAILLLILFGAAQRAAGKGAPS